MNVAGIDIGSNATRVTISKPPQNGVHQKEDLIKKYRFPCRLGTEVFTTGTLSESAYEKMDNIFSEISALLKKHNVVQTKGVATSAFRDASNGVEFLNKLSRSHSVTCTVISGPEEAKLMSQGLFARGLFTDDAAHLHVDIGGGSLELSCFFQGKFIFQESLDLGPLRLIEDTTSGVLISDYQQKIKLIDQMFISIKDKGVNFTGFKKIKLHGTGGNFKRLGTLRCHSFDKQRDDILKAKEALEMIKLYKPHPATKISEYTSVKKENAALILPSLLMIERILKFWPAKKIKISKLSLSHVLLDGLG